MKRYEVYDRWITQVVELSNKLIKTLSACETDSIEYIISQTNYGKRFTINKTWIKNMPYEKLMNYNVWKQRRKILHDAIEVLKSLEKLYDIIQPNNPPIPVQPKLISNIERCNSIYEEIRVHIRPKLATTEITIFLLKDEPDDSQTTAKNLNPILKLFEEEHRKTEEILRWLEEELPDNTLNFMAPTRTIKRVKTRKLSINEKNLACQSQKEVG